MLKWLSLAESPVLPRALSAHHAGTVSPRCELIIGVSYHPGLALLLSDFLLLGHDSLEAHLLEESGTEDDEGDEQKADQQSADDVRPET